jgi:hypothetical protein
MFDGATGAIEPRPGLRGYRRRQQNGETHRHESQEEFPHFQTPACCRPSLDTERVKTRPVAEAAQHRQVRNN